MMDTYSDLSLEEPHGILWRGQEVIVSWAEEFTFSGKVKGQHTALPCAISTPQKFAHRLLVEGHSLPCFNHKRSHH
jgi:hypothetical protein